MQNSIVSLNKSLHFGKLQEPHRNTYTSRQEKLAGQVREIANQTCPDDKKGRSYSDYYKDVFNLDLLIKPNNKTNSIELLAHNNSDDSFKSIKEYPKGIKPTETDFTLFTYALKDEEQDFREKIFTYATIGLMFLSACIAGGKNSAKPTLEDSIKTELVENAINKTDTTQTLNPFQI